jgi:hypothetical protein
MPVKNRYMTKSPIVMVLLRMAWPPTRIITTPMMPTMTVRHRGRHRDAGHRAVTLRSSLWTPCANTICSRFSAV